MRRYSHKSRGWTASGRRRRRGGSLEQKPSPSQQLVCTFQGRYVISIMMMFFTGDCKTEEEGWAAYHVHKEY